MKISEILLHREKFNSVQTIFSKDIKQRIKNGQIKIDGVAIKDDIDLNIETLPEPWEVIRSKGEIKNPFLCAGTFIFNLIKDQRDFEIDNIPTSIFALQLKIFGFEDIKNSNIKNDLTDILDNFFIIRVSKKDIFLIKRNV